MNPTKIVLSVKEYIKVLKIWFPANRQMFIEHDFIHHKTKQHQTKDGSNKEEHFELNNKVFKAGKILKNGSYFHFS